MRPSGKLGVAGLVALVVAGVVGDWLLHRTPAPAVARERSVLAATSRPESVTPAPVVDSELGTSEVKRELETLRAEVAAVRAEKRRAEPEPARETPEALGPEQEEQRFLTEVAALDAAFRNEGRDHAWAEGMSDEIREAAAAEGMPADLIADIDCRSRTCKVELGSVEARARDKGIQSLIRKLGASLPNVTYGHDGDLKAPKTNALYFALRTPDDDVPALARK